MNGYSKMRPSNKKTRSMDFSDLQSSSSSFSPAHLHTEESKEKSGISPQTPESKKGGRESSSPSSLVVVDVVKSQSQSHGRDSPPTVDEEEKDASLGSNNNNNNNNLVGAVKLTRTYSVAPANNSSPRFRIFERQSSRSRSRRTRPPSGSGSIQSAVKRVFSMRRSSSVSEKYCRIYDDHHRVELEVEPPAPSDYEDEEDSGTADADNNNNNIIATKTRSMKPNKKNGILNACKRLLGF